MRRCIAFEVNGLTDFPCRSFCGSDKFEIVFESLDRRQKDAEPVVSNLRGDSGANLAFDFTADLFDAVLLFGGGGER